MYTSKPTSQKKDARLTNVTKAIEDKINGAEVYIERYLPANSRISKKGSKEITLSGGETVDVYIWNAQSSNLIDDKAYVACFMPDNSTIVRVVASLSDRTLTRFFETLEIGDIPQS